MDCCVFNEKKLHWVSLVGGMHDYNISCLGRITLLFSIDRKGFETKLIEFHIFLEFCLTLFNSSGRFGHPKITFHHYHLCSKIRIDMTFLDFTQYCLTVVMGLVT